MTRILPLSPCGRGGWGVRDARGERYDQWTFALGRGRRHLEQRGRLAVGVPPGEIHLGERHRALVAARFAHDQRPGGERLARDVDLGHELLEIGERRNEREAPGLSARLEREREALLEPRAIGREKEREGL